MKNIKTKIAIALITMLPVASYAATGDKTLKTLAAQVVDYFNLAIELTIGLAVVIFIWNVFRYFFIETDRKEAGMYVFYSVIGFFVIFSFWGLVAVLRNTIDLDNSKPSSLPTSPFGNSGQNQSAPIK